MEWFIAVVVVATLGVAAMAAAGGMGEMSRDPVRDTYRQDLPADRLLGADDIQRLRFGITLRGYAMAQVDDLLDRLAAEIAARDARIAELTLPAGGGISDPAVHDPSSHPDEAVTPARSDNPTTLAGPIHRTADAPVQSRELPAAGRSDQT